MVDCCRQLWLLTCKNLILTWRSKVWALFELTGTVQLSPGRSFDALPIKGDASDIPRKIGFASSIQTHWCNHRQVSLAYYAREGSREADELMSELEDRFTDGALNVAVKVVKMDSEESMIDQLRADAPNNTFFGCAINRFIGGVIFGRLSTVEHKLDYHILFPRGVADYRWFLDQEWNNPFGSDMDYNKIPAVPPYWSSAFLSLQYAIDSLFINGSTSSGVEIEEVRLRRLPEATCNLNSVAAFLSGSSYLWGLSAFVLVIHTARQLATERSTVKYLQSSNSRLNTISDNNETDEGLLRTKAGIRVQQLIKVTVLLGHNGAGKSTTFSVISGITAPTSGRVLISGLDIQKQRSLCRRFIGLCPQGNALFDRLTVDEHLWFIHGLKGAPGSYMTEAEQLLHQLKLLEKSDELAMNLSGGQKRKLCVSMAVIGNSTVILLDEPTASMDPCARRDVESLIHSIKMDRTVLLTTHYMDEAELLGDRVAIMARGRVYCCGTPQFLKKRFGTGYVMTVVVTDNTNAQGIAGALTQVSRKYVTGATKGNVHGKQFEIILPKEDQGK
ncbi:unnamed protein product [Angiostrongylus costaricensis]|uniref:ABC transporter domain-containing protein n=1 Tax=Angiostrongylus costaricensis TaxID=334426 RepID=A0A0R3PB47_ANGCS|nr:unnamed protein product [Angiostrongylus costaricensis]